MGGRFTTCWAGRCAIPCLCTAIAAPADDIDACVADAKAQVALGYQALKLDPFSPEMGKKHRRYIDGKISAAGAAHAEDLMAALREGLGPDIELMIDAHGNFDVSTATDLCNRMMPYNLTWFEEPLQPESLEAHRQLRRNTDINLCIGERKYTRWDFLPYLTEGISELHHAGYLFGPVASQR